MINENDFLNEIALHSNFCFTQKQLKEELRTVTIIQSYVKKYKVTGKINIRLILNYFITLNNQFGSFLYDIIEYKIDELYIEEVNSFMDFLYLIPESKININTNKELNRLLREL